MRVGELWRYPVKSVGGEPLTVATVGPTGIDGDRLIAVRDERGEVTWAGAVPGLMLVRAVSVGGGVAELLLPDGERLRTDAPDVDSRLSTAVDAKVTLAPHRRAGAEAPLHVLTTTSLRSLAAALPGSAIDVTRFRPSLVLDDVPDETGSGYPEHGWIGRRLSIGALRLRFTRGCDRCVMITKATPRAPHDREVLRFVARELGNTFGVYAEVETPGQIRVGDEARWLD